MPSLREIFRHGSVIVIDAASSTIQVGLLTPNGADRWASSHEESGIGVFQCLASLGYDPQTAGAFVFCDGPGSVLGIRTVAMAIRTWCMLKPRPVYAYTSLALVAHATGRAEVGVIADARRDAWHHYQLGRGLRRVAAEELSGEMVMPEGFRHWSPLPPGVTTVPYSLAEFLPQIGNANLLRAVNEPDAFLHEEPSYATWTPQVHRAPVRS